MTDSLQVSGPDFDKAVLRLARVVGTRGPRSQAEVTLRVTDGSLAIEHPSAASSVPAQGTLGVDLRVSLVYLREAAALAAKSESVVLTFDGRFLKVGRVGVSATVVPRPAKERITVPLNASLADILAVSLTSTGDEIEASGLTRTVQIARTKRDRIVARAGKLLAPLGVTEATLGEFVDDQLRQGSAR